MMKKTKRAAFTILVATMIPIYMYLWSWALESAYLTNQEVTAQSISDAAALSGIKYFSNPDNNEYTLSEAALNSTSKSKARVLAVINASKPNPFYNTTPTITFTKTTLNATQTQITLNITSTLTISSGVALRSQMVTVKSQAQTTMTTS